MWHRRANMRLVPQTPRRTASVSVQVSRNIVKKGTEVNHRERWGGEGNLPVWLTLFSYMYVLFPKL